MQTVHVNDRGILTLPKSLRKAAGLENGGQVMVEVCQEGILLRPVVSFPIELYSDARIDEFDKQEEELKRHLHQGGNT